MDLSLLEAMLMAGDCMRRTRRLLWSLRGCLLLSGVLIAWAEGPLASAATSANPHGTVTVAFHSFSREMMDPAMDGTPGLPYRGQMFDWFIGATPDGKLSTDYGGLERYESNIDATVWTFVLKKGIK
jgi:ABC-type transport system substrate-binding protein